MSVACSRVSAAVSSTIGVRLLPLEPVRESPENPAGRREISCIEIGAHVIGPAFLAQSGLGQHVVAVRREVEEGRTSVVRVVSDFQKAVDNQAIGQTLHSLTAQSHAPSHPGNRGRPFPELAQDLPTCAGEVEIGNQKIGRRHQVAVDSKQLEDQLGEAQTGE